MKRIAAALLFIAYPAAAQEMTSTAHEWCDGVHGLSKALMHGRQIGLDMPDLMRMAEEHIPQASGGTRALAQSLIVAAYEVPRFNSETQQQREVKDFANDQYLHCVKARRN